MAKERESEFKTIVRVSPTEQVREQLLEAIKRDDYAEGDWLPSERALCEAFGVSRVSVREAIAGLEAMGVVTVLHGRGCMVNKTDADFEVPFGVWLHTYRDRMVELLKVRGALDELAAQEAAERSDADALTELQRVHTAFRTLAEEPGPDVAELIDLDVTFHNAVAQAAGGELLGNLLEELAGHIADSRRLTFSTEGQLQRSVREHATILEAIVEGDSTAAKRAAGEHARGVRRLLESLE